MHPNLKLLSNSSNILLHKCPRKFQLYKLLRLDDDGASSNIDLDFGSWVGTGIQELLIHKDMNKAMFAMMLSCKEDLDDEAGERSKKTFAHALIALDRFQALQDTELADFSLVSLVDGTPAVELGFILTCIEGFTYRGFLDALLINKNTNELVVLECKTTKFKTLHPAVYKNSGQGLGYSLITDAIAATMPGVKSSWQVLYPVYKCGAGEWEIFEFKKNNAQRAAWLRDLIIDIKQVLDYSNADHFPMRGESCYDFSRVCAYFEVCDMSDDALGIGDTEKIPQKIEAESKYAFKFDLIQLIAAQQEKHTS